MMSKSGSLMNARLGLRANYSVPILIKNYCKKDFIFERAIDFLNAKYDFNTSFTIFSKM